MIPILSINELGAIILIDVNVTISIIVNLECAGILINDIIIEHIRWYPCY